MIRNGEKPMSRATSLVLLSTALVFAAGCQEGPTIQEPDITELRVKPIGDPHHGGSDHHELLESLEYEEFMGWIEPGVGGGLVGYSETWPSRHPVIFSILVPQEALGEPPPDPPPGDPPPLIEFSLRVPTYDSYMEHPGLPLILRLQPEGERFLAPIKVTATYMPWAGDPPNGFWNAEPVYDEYGEVIDVLFNEYGNATVSPIPAGWQISFEVDHFSDWEVGDIPEASDDPYIEMWDDQNR